LEKNPPFDSIFDFQFLEKNILATITIIHASSIPNWSEFNLLQKVNQKKNKKERKKEK